jgi:hypothetical protein
MGEAKRKIARQAKVGAPTFYLDAMTGKPATAKQGGDPEAFFKQKVEDVETGGDASVPCAGCRECCYYDKVEIHTGEDTTFLKTEIRDGELVLQRRPDGACVHLGDNGCTVYEHRPDACRKYDCRVFSVFGVGDRFEGEHRSPTWAFTPRSKEGRCLLAAHQLAGLMGLREVNRSGKSWMAKDVVALAAPYIPKFLEVMRALNQMPEDELRKNLGLNQPVTPEQHAQALSALAGLDG